MMPELYEKLLKLVNDVKEVKAIQENCTTDNYMIGLYNGLECACAILEEREPVYLDAGI